VGILSFFYLFYFILFYLIYSQFAY